MDQDQKNNPETSGDLKARLSFGAKSRRAQMQEEDRRKAEAAEAAQRAEAERKQRDEQFSLAGAGPASEPDWQPLEVSEEELKRLEALPSEGQTGRRIVVAVGFLVALVLALGAGYYIGKAFFGRDLENRKVDEAAGIIRYVESQRASYFEAVDEHRQAITELAEKMEKLKEDPAAQLRELHVFLKGAQHYVEQYPPVSARDIFDNSIYNAALVPEVITFAQAIGTLYTMTDRMLDELPMLQRLGTGEEGTIQPRPMPATLAYEPAPQGEGAVPWNKGEFVQVTGEVFAAADESGGAVFKIPVKRKGDAAPVDMETGRIVEVDAWPVIARLEDGYRMALLERARYSLTVLKEASDKVVWSRLKARLEEFSQKEKYFTF